MNVTQDVITQIANAKEILLTQTPLESLKKVFFAVIKISAKVYIPHHICIIVCNFRLFI